MGGKVCDSGGMICMYRLEQVPRYGMWLQSPRWLIPKVALPQVPLPKKSEMGEARFRVCPHTTTSLEERR